MAKYILLILTFTFTLHAKELTHEQWKEDITQLANSLPKEHYNFFKNLEKSHYENSVQKLLQSYHQLSQTEIIVEMAKIVSLAKDGHTFIEGFHPLVESEFSQGLHFNTVPIKFYAFNDGIYVYAAHKDYQQYIGAKLESINGSPVAEVLNRISTMFPVENPMAVKSWGVYGLSIPAILHAYSYSNELSKASYTLSFGNNQPSKDITFPEIESHPHEKLGWVNDPQWVSAINNSPHYLSDLAKGARLVTDENNKFIYVQVNHFQKSNFALVNRIIDQAVLLSQQLPTATLVLDLRFNTGGETEIVNPQVKKLAASIANRNNNFYVILGRRTFSAASLMTTALEQYTNAVFVGEPTGINEHFFSNARNRITLLNSELKIYTSTSYWQPTNMNKQRSWITPHIYTPLTFQQFEGGIDPAMIAIKKKIKKQTIEGLVERFSQGELTVVEFLAAIHEFKRMTQNTYVDTEEQINDLGYELMERKLYSQASDVFKLNTEYYPNSYNAYDSLAESYLARKQSILALNTYKKALSLAAHNKYLQNVVKELESQSRQKP